MCSGPWSNERDGLGDETPPDYLTSCAKVGFYGCLMLLGQTVDDRVPQDAPLSPRRSRELCARGHTARSGWVGYHQAHCGVPDAWRSPHGSWNRSTLSGYAVVSCRSKTAPSGPPRDIFRASSSR